MHADCSSLKRGRVGRPTWLAKAAGSPYPKQTTSEPAAVGCFEGTRGRTAPSRPGGAKGPEQPGKKREGEREGGTGKRGPRTEAGRDHEPSECGASDTPHPRLVAEPPGINGASANGPLERVTLCRR